MNQPDLALLAQVDETFGHYPRPEHLTPEDGDFECMEFDAMWRSRNRETLKLKDVFPSCRSPWNYLLTEGMLYYLPAIIRLVLLDKKTTGPDWTGLTFMDCILNDRPLYEACTPAERACLADVIRHLIDTRSVSHDAALFQRDMERMWKWWSEGFGVTRGDT